MATKQVNRRGSAQDARPPSHLAALNQRRKAKPKLKPPAMPEPEPLMVRPDQAAKLIAVGRNAMYELLASGAIRSIKLGHSRLVPISELQRWIAEQLEDVDLFGGDAA